ncbi:MAG TPA: chitinase [Streptosporangiaceae bacterium]
MNAESAAVRTEEPIRVKRTCPGLRAGLTLALCVPLAIAPAIRPTATPRLRLAAATWLNGSARPVYAPYFETWTKDRIPAVARASGARRLILAFLQTPKRGSCSVAWNGSPGQIVKPGGQYVGQIARLRAMGGDVVPSFGGFSADQGGTEVADSCSSVPKIAKAYESVVTTYRVTALDMDVEANSLNNKAGIERRSKALRLLQEWAFQTHRRLRITFTIGVEPWGLPADCLAVLKSAVAHGVRFTVNIMAFDYYIKASQTGIDMGTAAVKALTGTHHQLARLFPGLSQRRLWALEGITLLPGIDDYPKKTEVTSLGDARQVLRFAVAHRLPLLSIWAIQRDNGGCPGTIDSNSCSGIKQPRWSFSHLLER